MIVNTVPEQNIINNEPPTYFLSYTLFTIIILSSISLTSSLAFLVYRHYVRTNEASKIQFNYGSFLFTCINHWKEKLILYTTKKTSSSDHDTQTFESTTNIIPEVPSPSIGTDFENSPSSTSDNEATNTSLSNSNDSTQDSIYTKVGLNEKSYN